MTIAVYHIARVIAPERLRKEADGAALIFDAPGIYKHEDNDDSSSHFGQSHRN